MSEEKKVCCICGKPKSGSYEGKQYCNKHWQSMYRYGQPYGSPRKRTNQYLVEGNSLRIITSKGDVILADAEDYNKLSKYSWCISKTGYPVANINGKVTKMHRYLFGMTNPQIVADHINHNPLDNRKTNLRICTMAENSRNKGGGYAIHGIRKTKHGKYSVRIMFQRKEYHIGNFPTYEEAVRARYEAEDKYHGEFGYHRSQPHEVSR